MTFKDKTMEHLTFDSVSSVPNLLIGNVTRLLDDQAFLFGTQNKHDALCTTLVLIHFGFGPTFLVF